MRAAALLLLALAACASAGAPASPREAPVFVEPFSAATTATGSPGARAEFFADVGREDLFVDRERAVCAPLMGSSAAVDPLAEVVRLSEGHRVAIINEAHDHPQHRAFIANVVSALRREGFSIYAAETFSSLSREALTWARVNDGYYTSEPTFEHVWLTSAIEFRVE